MANSTPVYSTESGRLCPECGRAVSECICGQRADQAVQGDGNIRVCRETKGRKGKGVTLISGVPLPADELKALAKKLKQACSTGGTVKDGVIEIQGDHRDRLLGELEKLGYSAKKAGG